MTKKKNKENYKKKKTLQEVLVDLHNKKEANKERRHQERLSLLREIGKQNPANTLIRIM